MSTAKTSAARVPPLDVRFQFTKAQADTLKALAVRNQMPVEAVVRRMVNAFLAEVAARMAGQQPKQLKLPTSDEVTRALRKMNAAMGEVQDLLRKRDDPAALRVATPKRRM